MCVLAPQLVKINIKTILQSSSEVLYTIQKQSDCCKHSRGEKDKESRGMLCSNKTIMCEYATKAVKEEKNWTESTSWNDLNPDLKPQQMKLNFQKHIWK